MERLEDPEHVLPLVARDLGRDELLGDPRLAQVARQLRRVVGIADRACNLLECHPGDRPVVVLVGIGQPPLDHAAAGAIPPVDRQAYVVDLLQPLLRLRDRIEHPDARVELVDPLEVASGASEQQLARERPAVAVPVDRSALAGCLHQLPAARKLPGLLARLELVDQAKKLEIIPTHRHSFSGAADAELLAGLVRARRRYVGRQLGSTKRMRAGGSSGSSRRKRRRMSAIRACCSWKWLAMVFPASFASRLVMRAWLARCSAKSVALSTVAGASGPPWMMALRVRRRRRSIR